MSMIECRTHFEELGQANKLMRLANSRKALIIKVVSGRIMDSSISHPGLHEEDGRSFYQGGVTSWKKRALVCSAARRYIEGQRMTVSMF